MLVYKCLQDIAPPYLRNILQLYIPSRTLRSSYNYQLEVPHISTNLSKRSFSYADPELWNSLPLEIKIAPSLSSFKKCLKTYLFRSSFQ